MSSSESSPPAKSRSEDPGLRVAGPNAKPKVARLRLADPTRSSNPGDSARSWGDAEPDESAVAEFYRAARPPHHGS